jgi:hypothetical protein
MTPARRGRPPIPETEARNHRLVALVTQLEFEEIKKLAEQKRQSISKTAHDLLRAGLANRERRI